MRRGQGHPGDAGAPNWPMRVAKATNFLHAERVRGSAKCSLSELSTTD